MSECAANRTADPPEDCNYPFCGCSKEASEVIEKLLECGWGNVETEMRKASNLAMLLRRVLHNHDSPAIRQHAWNYLQDNNLLGSPSRDTSSQSEGDGNG